MESDDTDPRLPAWRPAVYTPDSDRDLRGNVMAEVWPGPHTDVIDWLMHRFPKFEDDFKDRPLEERLEQLDRLDGFNYPFANLPSSFRKIISVVRSSFVARNPRNPLCMKALMAASAGRLKKVPRLSEMGGGGKLGYIITGISGTGKSSFLDRVQSLYMPRPWLHTSYDGRPCSWLQLGGVRIKTKRSFRATLELAVQHIDFQLRTDYFSQRSTGGTSTRYENTTAAALTGHFAPYLMLDDFERLARLPDNEANGILEALVDLMEHAGIPIILAGTIQVRKVFQKYPAVMHKFLSGGIVNFQPIDEGTDFNYFVGALKQRNVSVHPVRYSDDFNYQLWLHTMGVHRIVREAMKWVLWRHAKEPKGVDANKKLLESIFANEMQDFNQSLHLIRQVKLGVDPHFTQHQLYEDFIPPEAPKVSQVALDVVQKFRVEKNATMANLDKWMTAETFGLLSTLQRAHELAAQEGDVFSEEEVPHLDRHDPRAAPPKPSPPASKSGQVRKSTKKKGGGNSGKKRPGKPGPDPIDPSDIR